MQIDHEQISWYQYSMEAKCRGTTIYCQLVPGNVLQPALIVGTVMMLLVHTP